MLHREKDEEADVWVPSVAAVHGCRAMSGDASVGNQEE